MEERIERLFKEGKLDIVGMIHAVDKGLITEDKFAMITNMTIKNARKEYAE